jgi:hypothetical protein
MKDNNTYSVFLAQQKDNPDSYKIYLSGKETDIFVTKDNIAQILSHSQFTAFVRGDLIFDLPKTTLEPYLQNKPPADLNKRFKPQ